MLALKKPPRPVEAQRVTSLRVGRSTREEAWLDRGEQGMAHAMDSRRDFGGLTRDGTWAQAFAAIGGATFLLVEQTGRGTDHD